MLLALPTLKNRSTAVLDRGSQSPTWLSQGQLQYATREMLPVLTTFGEHQGANIIASGENLAGKMAVAKQVNWGISPDQLRELSHIAATIIRKEEVNEKFLAVILQSQAIQTYNLFMLEQLRRAHVRGPRAMLNLFQKLVSYNGNGMMAGILTDQRVRSAYPEELLKVMAANTKVVEVIVRQLIPNQLKLEKMTTDYVHRLAHNVDVSWHTVSKEQARMRQQAAAMQRASEYFARKAHQGDLCTPEEDDAIAEDLRQAGILESNMRAGFRTNRLIATHQGILTSSFYGLSLAPELWETHRTGFNAIMLELALAANIVADALLVTSQKSNMLVQAAAEATLAEHADLSAMRRKSFQELVAAVKDSRHALVGGNGAQSQRQSLTA